MSSRHDEGAIGRKKKKRDRDNTPSAIRHAAWRPSLSGRPSMEAMPLLEMPKSQRIWRKVRRPLFGLAVLILLTVTGFITRGIMVASKVEKTIKNAEALEFKGTLEQTAGAEETLRALYENYPDEQDARAAWAWQAVLQSLLWEKTLDDDVKNLLDTSASDGKEVVLAARGGAALLDGRARDALNLLSGAPDGPRTALVRAAALDASGNRDKARELFGAKILEYPTYIPLLVAAAGAALDANDRAEALKISALLLQKSPTHLLGAAAVLRLALTEWGEPLPNETTSAVWEHELSRMMPRIASAPPKIFTLGQYLKGRVALASGRAEDAAVAFDKVLERRKDSDTAAWAALAARMRGGAQSALALLEKYEEVNGPEVMDIRAQCLLEYHRVRQAETVIEALRKTGAIPHRAAALSWALAVRSGDMKTALEKMPAPMAREDKWLALEMYFLLAAAGDRKAVKLWEEAAAENHPSCSKIVHLWHSKALGRAIRQFGKKRLGECAHALIPRLMRGHMPVEEVSRAAETNRKQSGGSLIFEVDRALAVRLTQGYDAGLRILDAVAARNPEGAPLLERLGRAYLEMHLPEKVTALLKNSEHPELSALNIFALEMQKKNKEARALEEKALSAAKTSGHPALRYFVLRRMLASNNAAGVRDWVTENSVNTLGQWTAETAKLGARAMWALEEKKESERFLQKVARRTLGSGGAGEALDTFMVQVEQNIRRSGKYKNRALVVIRTLREESVKDPRMSYWLAVENITNGSERVGIRMLEEIPRIDPSYAPYYKRLASMERLGESETAAVKKILPYYTP